jgi:protein-tyrosine sulfotransferase
MLIDHNSGLSQPPIFILGITPRSGTNFLHDLLVLHPHCQASLAGEDYLTAHSQLLLKYVKSVSKGWKPHWKIKKYVDQPERLVVQYLGEGLISFLSLRVGPDAILENEMILGQSPPKRLVTKTPSVENLSSFFTLFPQAYLIILIRDGRAVVESSKNTFRWNVEVVTRNWVNAARTILEFEQQVSNPDHRYLIVRYEDLYQETEKELKRIFSFLALDANCYDFEKATNLPVRGSSELYKKGKVHWNPVEKLPDFNPLSRWSYWSQARRRRFNWIAGKYMVHFGYCQPAELDVSFIWQIWNFILDIKWIIRTMLARTKQFLMEKLARQE